MDGRTDSNELSVRCRMYLVSIWEVIEQLFQVFYLLENFHHKTVRKTYISAQISRYNAKHNLRTH